LAAVFLLTRSKAVWQYLKKSMAFFAIEPLTLMISSPSRDLVPFRGKMLQLSELRRAIKSKLEAIFLAGKQVFEVWIHEDEPGLPGDENPWDACINRAKRADIMLVLYNGDAGWAGTTGQLGDKIGICHAEFEVAYNKTPSKVRSVQFPPIAAVPGSPNERFQRYFQNQGVWGAQVTTGEEAIEYSEKAAVGALLDLARGGIFVGSKGSYFSGEALTWSRMDYQNRRKITRETVVEYLRTRSRSGTLSQTDSTVIYPIGGQKIALVCDCIPGPMSTPAARELVGQPFLLDFRISATLPAKIGGPVHLIACHKGVTEAQAIRQLGFPDAIVVSAPFGVYVADELQKIQMVFIAHCRDETTTRRGVHRFLQWLDQQGEDRFLAQRAVSRRKISDLICSESQRHARPSQTSQSSDKG